MNVSTSQKKQIVLDFCNLVWNKRDINAGSALVHEEVTYQGPRVTVKGKSNYIDLLKSYMSVFSDSNFNIIDMMEENDNVMCHAEFTGVQSGSYGEIPPTNNQVKFQLMSIIKIKDGKIISETEIFDEYGFLLDLNMELVQKQHAH